LFDADKDNLSDDPDFGNIDNGDDDEESKKDMTHAHRYYLFKYFQSLADDELAKLLVADSGVDPNDAKLKLDKDSLSIHTKTTKKNYSKIAQKLASLLKNEITYQRVDSDTFPVGCIGDRRFTKNFQKKFEDKYNVILSDVAQVFRNRGGH